MNKSLALIGAGNIGRRHLQGLLRAELPLHIYVVDPFVQSLDAAKEVLAGAGVPTLHTVSFHQHIAELPKQVDLIIIATAADTRKDVLKALLESVSTRLMILEKVLFQKLSDYAVAAELLNRHHIKAFVNCPRRYFPHYQALHQDAFSSEWRMTVIGSNWGLACNAVHFIDLYNYLSGQIPNAYSTVSLDPTIIDSKRAGFIEVNGVLQSEDGRLRIECTTEPGNLIEVVLAKNSERIVIKEGQGKLEGFDTAYRALPLSEMAHLPVLELFAKGTCQLTPFETSARIHEPFIDALTKFVADKMDVSNGLPIT
jgi:predicted dehydrogenase